MLTLVQKENEQDQVIFQEIYFKSFQIHQLTIKYCFEHTNHDIVLSFLFQNLHKLFLLSSNLHQ